MEAARHDGSIMWHPGTSSLLDKTTHHIEKSWPVRQSQGRAATPQQETKSRQQAISSHAYAAPWLQTGEKMDKKTITPSHVSTQGQEGDNSTVLPP
ncbi:hypothetical protein AC579_6724 [Pseudocercospora musae]|uniref:Uncharacterized protein n=1 Tax=Pseudocercospora musae TaxID=113226 RepID=A0A139HW24_9PEZI|nr:hypothetical protein AC579_6724 [Pseudocercospora musae]